MTDKPKEDISNMKLGADIMELINMQTAVMESMGERIDLLHKRLEYMDKKINQLIMMRGS